MKHIIMILIVIGLILIDYATGLIKAYINGDVSSKKMRIGGLNKLSELLVMTVSCGLEVGIDLLGKYYRSAELAAVAGTVAAGKAAEKVLDKTGYKRGDKTLGVYALKQRLKALGYSSLDETKGFGGGTEQAVNSLLKKWGYKQSGVAGEKFIKKVMGER